MDYSKINLDEAEQGMKTLSGNEFEMKSWKEMEEGEQWVKQMLLVGVKDVKTPNGPTQILQFQHPTNKSLKRCVWTNTILNNAMESGDLEEKTYYLYTITYLGMKEKKGGGKPYHNIEVGCTDLRKFGFVAPENQAASVAVKDNNEGKVMMTHSEVVTPSEDLEAQADKIIKEGKKVEGTKAKKKAPQSLDSLVDSLV